MRTTADHERSLVATPADHRQFNAFYQNVAAFIDDILAGPIKSMDDFIPGTEKIRFFEQYLPDTRIHIDDHREQPAIYGGLSYEQAVFHRLLTERPFNMLILLGGLGAGKSTALHHLTHLLVANREGIDAQFPCACQPCHRTPIYIEFHMLDRKFTADHAIAQIYKQIRFVLYERLVSEWLTHCHIPTVEVHKFDGGYKILRRLMVINDLQSWAQEHYPGEFPLTLEITQFTTEPLFDRASVSLQAVKALVDKHRPHSAQVAAQLDKLTDELTSAADFTSLLLRFYASRCAPWKPSSLLMIDNLDQLPTDTIERITDQLSFFASRGPIPPMLVPLRPSSLAPKAFERLPAYMHHYGPNCFELMLHRLQKYVLTRSYASLTGEEQQDPPLPKIFVKPPTQDELHAFLVASYLYAKIATAGLSADGATRLSNGVQRLPIVHSDFADKLEAMSISEGALNALSQTIGALVGTCARYAAAQVTQYYISLYRRPEMLTAILRSGITVKTPATLRLGYRQLIGTVLSHPEPGEPERIANLYRPSEQGANAGLPSLVKIRLLVELGSQKRATVRQLLRTLALYGIPQELGLLGLNYLHDKARLLVWFSKNSDLLEGEADFDQYVTIAEHGLSYLRYVLGDFEYIWFCATEIPPRLDREIEANFRARLEQYTRLMQGLALTEWKQLAFVRCIERETTDEASVINSHRMLTLFILYCSLERAILSSRRSLAGTPRKSAYHQNVASLIAEVCTLILASQERYRLCYCGTGYLSAYKEILDRARPALNTLLQAEVLDQDQAELVHRLLASWDEQLSRQRIPQEGTESSIPGEEAFTPLCLSYSRGLIPDLSGLLARVTAMKDYQRSVIKMYLWRFVRGRELLVGNLGRRLPLYSVVEDALSAVVNAAADILATRSHPELAALIGTTAFEWFTGEAAWLEGQLSELRTHAFNLEELTGYAQLDVAKRKMNKIMGIYAGIARRIGVTETEHLEIKWR
jgi:hypothetical protein